MRCGAVGLCCRAVVGVVAWRQQEARARMHPVQLPDIERRERDGSSRPNSQPALRLGVGVRRRRRRLSYHHRTRNRYIDWLFCKQVSIAL